MPVLNPEQSLILAAARLARNAPDAWEHFLGAFSKYSDAAARSCIQSPLDEIVRTQGRAQATARLDEMFRHVKEQADKIEGMPK